MKRVFDILVALALAPIAFLICLIALIPIWIESRAPPLFVQTRLGRDEQEFSLLKIRTMHPKTRDAGSHEIGADALLRSGVILRRLKIDELPQLWNVLNGTMSLVGPRPGLPGMMELRLARREHNVFALTPGITGPAQIAGIDMSTPEKLAKVDRSYAGNWSLKRDLDILWATATGSGRGDAAALGNEK